MTVSLDKDKPLILLADDDEDILALVAFRLEAGGYEVVTANDGEEALAAAIERDPALAVLDVRMPKLTGLDVVRKIRAQSTGGRRMPVILLSASVQEAHVARGFEAGADDYMKKPFSPQELLARIEANLEP